MVKEKKLNREIQASVRKVQRDPPPKQLNNQYLSKLDNKTKLTYARKLPL